MKRTFLVVVAVAALASVAACRKPTGWSDAGLHGEVLRDAFNAGFGKVRVLALVSPS